MQQTEVKQPTKQTNSKQELKSNSNIEHYKFMENLPKAMPIFKKPII